jgi:hypothetical protein
MKYLAIIATSKDFNELWNFQNGDFHSLPQNPSDKKLLIWLKDDECSFPDYTNKIAEQINGTTDFELGVIFHKLNGDAEANTFREKLRTSFNGKLAFCEWYSSNKRDFWNETDTDANLPYNSLKKAWKDSNGDKEKTFGAVWDYFAVDQAIENPLKKLATALPFDYVYQNTEELRNAKSELETAINKRLNK